MKPILRSLFVTIVIAQASAVSALANVGTPPIFFVTDEGSVQPDGAINWAEFSQPVPSQITIHGLAGYTATITEARSQFQMRHFRQSPVSPGLTGFIQGSFAPLEDVLSTGFGPNGPMTLTFSSPVAQVGMQIQGGWYGTFIADISAYDQTGSLLGAFSRSGLSQDRADDSAPFFGLNSTEVNISKLVIDVEPYSNFDHYFFISGPTISLVPVPEPATYALFVLGCAGFCVHRRRSVPTIASNERRRLASTLAMHTSALIPRALLCAILVTSWSCSKTDSDQNAAGKLEAADQSKVADENSPNVVIAKTSEKSAPTERLNFYTVDHYDAARNPADDLAMTIDRAKAEKKNILIQVGGDWCGWCKLMSTFMETNEKVRANILNNYLVMKVTENGDKQNAGFLSQYPAIHGYPHVFVLDSDGKLLHSQDTAKLEEGRSYNENVYLEFLNKWKPARQ